MTLFDKEGYPTAYLDDDETILLWDGTPVAYLENDNIYGSNDKHLSQFEYSTVWNHQRERCGFSKNSLLVFAKHEPFKAFNKFKPFKSFFKEFAPFRPFESNQTIDITFIDFLKTEKKQLLLTSVISNWGLSA